MRPFLPLLFLSSLAVPLALAGTDAPPAFGEAESKRLAADECLVLDHRPDETASTKDARFVTVARLIRGSRETIWETIHDKEKAADFLESVLESKVLESQGNEILVEQRTRVGGPKGAYRYRLRHVLQPMTRADFTYAGGELKDVEGAWWIFDGPAPGSCLVVYTLHIDAGLFAPQVIVKAGMKTSMPKAVEGIAKEVERREAAR